MFTTSIAPFRSLDKTAHYVGGEKSRGPCLCTSEASAADASASIVSCIQSNSRLLPALLGHPRKAMKGEHVKTREKQNLGTRRAWLPLICRLFLPGIKKGMAAIVSWRRRKWMAQTRERKWREAERVEGGKENGRGERSS